MYWAIRTLAKVVLSIDVSLAVLWYVAVTLAVSEAFDIRILSLTVGFALVPDLDFAPYLVLRHRLRRPSHRRIGHHPLLWIPTAVIAGVVVDVIMYGGTRSEIPWLCVGAVALHFVHDAASPQGLHLLSPFSWRHYSLSRGRWRQVTEQELDIFFARKGRQPRSLTDEFDRRLTRTAASAVVLWLAALITVGVFAVQ